MAERLESGKAADGTVTLGAYHQGGNVVIEVKDDGRGLNVDVIRQKGIERGLIRADKEHSEEEIWNLIFHPGLSTHKVATAISGRGVGMDVVKRNIEQLGGRVDIFSEEGKGTKFLVKLPLTMAIVDGMLVRIGTERYIIPTAAITESLKPKPEQISSVVQKGEVINVRGELIPLLKLHDLFQIPNGHKDITDSLVIIVGNETERRGLLVDDLLGQQQVVIKNLDKRLRGVGGFSGSSILGDGLVGLIMDIGGLFKMA
jgi:two-component system chemotaxis sensor kinase CheA